MRGTGVANTDHVTRCHCRNVREHLCSTLQNQVTPPLPPFDPQFCAHLGQSYGSPSSYSGIFTDSNFTSNWCGGSGGGLIAIGNGNLSLNGLIFSNNSVAYRNDVSGTGSYQGGFIQQGWLFYYNSVYYSSVIIDCGGEIVVA